MPDVQHLRPADMTPEELDAALLRAANQRAEATTPTRRLVLATIIDRLLEELYSRQASVMATQPAPLDK